MGKLKQLLKQTFLTHIGRGALGILLCIIGGVLSPNGVIGEWIYDWDQGVFWVVMFYIGSVMWVGEVLLFIGAAIVNGIKSLSGK